MTAARPALSGSVLYETESAFCETSSFSSPTRLQVIEGLDVSGLSQSKININPLVQYVNDGVQDVRGVYGGSFSISMILGGETTNTASTTTTVSDLCAFLGYALGLSSFASSAGTTISGGASTTTSFDTAAASGFAAGSLCKLGALQDGDGEGQFYPVSAHSASAITSLIAAPGAPADSAVVYSPSMAYPDPNPDGNAQSFRCRLLTGNLQYECRGCWISDVSISGLSPGELPKVTFTVSVAYFNEISVTFPATESTSAEPGKPTSAGSFFYNDVGTSTRKTACPVSFDLSIALQRYPIMGNCGNYERQTIVGVRNGPTKATFTATFDAEATGTQTWADLWDTDADSVAWQHVLYTVNQDVAVYFPKVKLIGERPTQVDVGGLNRVRVMFEAVTGGTTTTDLTASSFRIAMA